MFRTWQLKLTEVYYIPFFL